MLAPELSASLMEILGPVRLGFGLDLGYAVAVPRLGRWPPGTGLSSRECDVGHALVPGAPR